MAGATPQEFWGAAPATHPKTISDRLAAEGEMPEGVDRILGKPITNAQLQEAVTSHDPSRFVAELRQSLRAAGAEKSQNAAGSRGITMNGGGPTGSDQPSQESLA